MSTQVLPAIEVWCPYADEVTAAEFVGITTEDCCEGGARRQYECGSCGRVRHRPGREP